MDKMVLDKSKNIHFVGIGGIGMSGVARVLLEMGYAVSGSDIEMNSITRAIESMGAKIFKGHRHSNIPESTGTVVYSSSITRNNPEIVAARERRIRVVHRAEMLGEIFNGKKGVAITGTHGKTTTTSFVSVMLEDAGMDPTVVIGAEVGRFEGNARFGKGAYAVAEADESDSSFLHIKPFHAILTNLEMEHVDHFRTIKDAVSSYRSFIGNVKNGGTVFYNHSDENLKNVLKGFGGRSVSFGFSEEADIYAEDIKMNGFNTTFKCFYRKALKGDVALRIPGRHNVLNALAAIGAGLSLGIRFEKITASLGNFNGAMRRFQMRASSGPTMLIDDYAHHPTEIRAVLDACRNWKGKIVRAVFQPHRFTRTKFLAEDFGKCFEGVDELILTDIYAASEKPIKGISAKTIYDKVMANASIAVKMMKKEDVPRYIMGSRKKDEMILILGAGDIKKVADELTGRLNAESLKGIFKGDLIFGEPLSSRTSFRIGGPADIWAEPEDEADLVRLLRFSRERGLRTMVIGNGSNILAGDNGFGGIMIHLGSSNFKGFSIRGTTVKVGSGLGLQRLVRLCCEKGLAGLESMVGIPGTVGGAVYMNAGGWKNPIFENMGSLVESLRVMDYEGSTSSLSKEDITFGYRHSSLSQYIILEAVLKLEKADKRVLVPSSVQFLKMKREKQVLDIPSAGCIFKNPQDSQFTCGQMIEMVGLKGKRVGNAEVSRKHANFIVNRGGATCKDVLELAELIRRKIRDNYNIDLELEVKVI